MDDVVGYSGPDDNAPTSDFLVGAIMWVTGGALMLATEAMLVRRMCVVQEREGYSSPSI